MRVLLASLGRRLGPCRHITARDYLPHTRRVSTLSPLGIAFNTKPEKKLNFSFTRENVGLFGIQQLKEPTGFHLLQQLGELEADELVSEACSPTRTRKLVAVFDQLSDCLCRVADLSDFVRVAHPDQRYSTAAEEASVAICALVERLNTNTDIHAALANVLQNGDSVPTDAVDHRVAELFMFDFEQSGIHLEPQKRDAFVQLNERVLMLGTHFTQGCQRQVSISKDKLPQHLKFAFALDGDNVTVNSLFSDHHSDMVREAAYRLYLYPDPRQEGLLSALLDTRDTLARLVEFPTYAHRALRGTMAQTPEAVMDFLENLADKIRPRAEEDFKDILNLKQTKGSSTGTLMPWDPPYYSGLARHERCLVNSQSLAPYFSLGSCMEGLSGLFKSLYGITLEHVTPEYGELWSHDVHKLAVTHETDGVLGYIFCDLFERPGKPHQDCHFTVQGGREIADGCYQDPMVVLMMNFPPPRGHVPSLLTPSMVENLFHEFGHAMHSMLGRTRYQHVTGTRCPTDFAEVPSVLMEYFATDPRVVRTFARHWQTGEVLSDETLHGLCRARDMFAASEMQLQVFYSILDQVYHGQHPLQGDTTDVLADLQGKYYSLPHVPGTAWQQRFGHIVGYGAKYYSYLMSRAVAARIWHTNFKADPFSREAGERYSQKMLAHGGSKHPSVLYEDMLGEKPTTENLVQSLLDDLDAR